MHKPFIMSIETHEGKSFKYGFDLGTIEPIARVLCEERYHARIANGQSVVTIGLMRDGRVVDRFMGDRWANG